MKRVEKWTHVLVFVFLSEAFLPLAREITAGPNADPSAGSALTQVVFLALYSLSVPLLLIYATKGVPRRLLLSPIWLLVLYVCASFFWSALPFDTLRRVIALAITLAYAFLLSLRLSLDDLVEVLATALLLGITLSVAAVLLAPQWAVMGAPHPGAWRGVYAHKNILGRISVIGFLVCGYRFLLAKGGVKKTFWAAGAAIAAIAIVGAASATSLALVIVMGVAALTLTFLVRVGASFGVKVASFLVLFAIVVYTALAYQGAILESLGRDETLTGRADLWPTAVAVAQPFQPWGVGYGAFWTGAEGLSGQVWEVLDWEPKHGHNGYLDIYLDLGIMGLALTALVLGWYLIRLTRLLGARGHQLRVGLLWLLLVFMLLYNLTESVLLRPNNIFSVLLLQLALRTEALNKAYRSGELVA